MNEQMEQVPRRAAGPQGAAAQVDALEEGCTPADYFAGKRCPGCGSGRVMVMSVEAQGSVELGVFVCCEACGHREEV